LGGAFIQNFFVERFGGAVVLHGLGVEVGAWGRDKFEASEVVFSASEHSVALFAADLFHGGFDISNGEVDASVLTLVGSPSVKHASVV
jgi:hypothetical protein